MKVLRHIKLMAILALVAAGCDRSMISSSGDVALEIAGKGTDPSNQTSGCGDLPTQPDSIRVDLYTASFSDPLNADSPLFPVGQLDRALLLGTEDGEPLRVETTRLPGSRTIVVNNQEVEVIISQYVAWVGGRIHELAIDWYAQDDNGAVWYFGEDVFNYEDGVVADTHGTWLAGREGPVAMITPADPQIGNVWRPENACPIVFEEVTATQTGVTVQGPNGPVSGALIVRELHMDGSTEDKTFAPGYGEFSTGDGSNLEAVALAVPTDALPGPVPDQVEALSNGAERIFDPARSGRWRETAALAEEMNEAWDEFQAGGVPPMLDTEMSEALKALDAGIAARDKEATRQASVNVALASLDFELRYEDRQEIDRDLIEVWSRQLIIDMRAHDRGAVLGDLATIQIIRDRLSGGARQMDAELNTLRAAATSGDLAAVTESAAKFHDIAR